MASNHIDGSTGRSGPIKLTLAWDERGGGEEKQDGKRRLEWCAWVAVSECVGGWAVDL
jgi:hypothetical protein